MSALIKVTASLVVLEIVCVAIVHSPLSAHVAAVAGQSQITSGSAIGAHASPLVATLVIGAQMAAATFIPFAIIACILHACILQGAMPRASNARAALQRTGKESPIDR
jgi:hypothetical protein